MSLVARIAYNIGVRIWNPKLNKHVRSSKPVKTGIASSWKNGSFEMLKRIVTIAYERTPFYRGLYTQAGIAPGDIRSLQDLEKLPVIEKAQLLSAAKQIQIRDPDSKQKMVLFRDVR